MFKRISLRAVTSALIASAVLPITAATVSASPTLGVRDEAGADRCPEVAVVAARGSEQNHDLQPTGYGPQAPWVSNGFEAETLRGFLLFAEQRHLERTGESLMADVPVLALDDTVYPAALPVPELAAEGEEIGGVEAARRLNGVLAETPAHRIVDNAATQLVDSVGASLTGIRATLAGYEASTGCRPGYLLLGFSQGAFVLTLQEQWLHGADRLAGVIYLGNPLLAPGDRGIVTHPVRGGVFRQMPPRLRLGAPTDKRLNYCLPGDFICDVDAGAVVTALTSHGGVHNEYFLPGAASEADVMVVDQFASWLKGYTSHP